MPSTGQPGSAGIGDHVDLVERAIGRLQNLPGQRQYAPDVVAAGQFRHHAAIGLVHVDLAVQGMGQQCRNPVAMRLHQSDTGFVAGRLDSQNQQIVGGSFHQP
jgi:hypothetical protein